jgi:3-(3-hydroxy-phenyl)propionate hydroxylase
MKTLNEPVIIAGAGPAGCAIALNLALHGVPVVLLEASAELPVDLRASTFQPATLDLLDTLGNITPHLVDQGLIAQKYQYRDRRSGQAAVFDLRLIADETKYPFRLQCEQYRFTQLAVAALQEMPEATVIFNHRVEEVEQHPAGVVVHAETPDHGFRAFHGSYLVGADGANSRVRRCIRVNFEGFTYPERFLVVSTPFDVASAFPGLDYVNYVSDPDLWCVLLKTRALWRVLVPTDPGAADGSLLADEFVQRTLADLTGLDRRFEITHRTLYRIHQRVAQKWRIGRVLLVGDACHVNNPLGGMGMNGGLHDAFNLAEKLLAVLRGEAGCDLLDLYERQRRGICVKFVQEHSIRNKQMMEEKDPQAQARRHAEMMRTAADPTAARNFMMRGSMIESLRDAAAIR